MSTDAVLSFAQEQVNKGSLVALVTVTDTTGSSPASPGQVIAVAADGTSKGTVGGGATEHRLIQRAAEAIKAGEKVFRFSFDHAENGMVCGGGMSGFGNILGNENHLFIFGAGHIGQSLAKIALTAGFSATVIDDRAEFAEAFSGVNYIACMPEDYSANIRTTPTSYLVICTRGHKTDDDALRFCLSQPHKYIGMIGSAKKVEAVFQRLRQSGYTEEQLAGIYTPIGLDIASAIPAEIAVSIMAEILLIKNSGTLAHKRARNHCAAEHNGTYAFRP